MIHFRYSIILMISVFLSLGVGIFIGFTMDSERIIDEQQTQLVLQIERKFGELRNENILLSNKIIDLEQENHKGTQLLQTVFNGFVKDSLNELKVIVIETNTENVYSNTIQFLKDCGANVCGQITINQSKFDNINQIRDYYVGIDNKFKHLKNETLISIILNDFAYSIATGTSREVVNILKENNYMSISGEMQNTSSVDFIIFALGHIHNENSFGKSIELSLLKEIKNMGIPVIAVETEEIKDSALEYYKKERVSTIDNVDTIAGQLSLIGVLCGIEGNYGVKDTADILMPDNF